MMPKETNTTTMISLDGGGLVGSARGESPGARDALADAFTEQALDWARSHGLLCSNAPFHRAAANYALTAFGACYPIDAEVDADCPDFRECAGLLARYMLLVAAGDEGIFDVEMEGETPELRRVRLASAARFLVGVIHGGPAEPPPGAPAGTLLISIAEGWQTLLGSFEGQSHPALLSSFRRALGCLYEASVKEYDEAMIDNPLFRSLSLDDDRCHEAARTITEEYGARVPSALRTPLAALVAAATEDLSRRAELRIVLYLIDADNTIGAGLLFRAAALLTRVEAVSPPRIEALSAAAEILNYRLRLANDLSEISTFDGRDRDGKETSCSMLVSGELDPLARRLAIAEATAVAGRVAGWLESALSIAGSELSRQWPWMARLVRRAAFLGKRSYEIGHYKTLARAQMSTLFDEMESHLAQG